MSNPDPPGSPVLTVIEGGVERAALAHELLLEYISPLSLDRPRVKALEASLFAQGQGKIHLAGGTDTFKL
jgi:hypothetical protein